jgi:hypothetical protein
MARWVRQVWPVASQAAQVALSLAQEGDVAVRSDTGGRWIHNGGSADTIADWTLLSDAAAVAAIEAHVADVANPHVVTKAQVGLSNVTNTADGDKPVSTAQAAADALRIPLTQKGADNGVATLDGDGLVPASQLPVGSGSGLPATEQTKTANYTAVSGDRIFADASGGPFTITLPATGDVIVIKTDSTANAVAVAGTINGDAGGATIDAEDHGALFSWSTVHGWRVVAVTAAVAGGQPLDADLTAIAALTTTSYGRSLLTLADAAALLAAAGAQASNANLTTLAGLTPSNDDVLQRKAGAWTNRTMAQVKTDLALVKADVGLGNAENTADSAKAIAGDVTGTLGASTVAKLRGKNLPAPTASEDQLGFKYDHASGAWVYTSLGGGSGIPASTVDAKGDLIVGTANDTVAREAVGANEQVRVAASGETTGAKWKIVTPARKRLWRRTGSLHETFDREICTSAVTLVTGRMHCAYGIVLEAGVPISSITFHGNGAANTPTNQFFAIVDASLNVLAKTVDDTTTAWGANAEKTLTITGGYTPSNDVAVYLGIVVVATTPPTVFGLSVNTLMQKAPVIGLISGATYSNPASVGATITNNTYSAAPYAYCS